MEHPKTLSIWWLRGIATLFLAPPAIVLLLKSNLEVYLSTVSPIWLVNGSVALLFTISLLAIFLILNRPWLKWDEPTGTWINRFNGLRYCEKCKAINKVVTPLKNEITGWRCMVCERWYADPARRPEEREVASSARYERI